MDAAQIKEVNERLELLIHRFYTLLVQAGDSGDGRDRKETSRVMQKEIVTLIHNLSSFSEASEKLTVEVPMDVIGYVELGRNPDIYNREFVEALQGLNRGMAGRVEAYAQFRDALAVEMKASIPGVGPAVDMVVRHTLGKPVP